MFTAALFTTARLWKQPRCPTTDKWIKKIWYIYTMEFYLIRENEVMLFAGKWTEPENTMLIELRLQRPRVTCGVRSTHKLNAHIHVHMMHIRTGKRTRLHQWVCLGSTGGGKGRDNARE
jgi:hypothetical protein